MCYSHSRKPDFPITHSSPLSMWLSILFFFLPFPLKPRCHGRVTGFVGGGGNITIATALPPSSFVFLYLIFCACLRLRFLDAETNPGLWRPVHAVCRILCSNVQGLAGNHSDQTVTSSQYDTVLL